MQRFCKKQIVRRGELIRAQLCFLVWFCLLGVQAAAQTGQFIVPPQYAVPGFPYAVAVGDFNGDGRPDLAVSNNFAGHVYLSILLGNGDGTFQTPVNYRGQFSPGSPLSLPVAAGDFNGDGKLDLVVANYEPGTISVFLGNGDGTFQPHVDYATPGGAMATSVVVGDFNGDGKPDLAVTAGGGVSIYLNGGTGAFPTRKDYDTGVGFVYLAVGDFNKDGKLDLAAVDCPQTCQSPNGSAGSVAILLGNGDGTFQAPVNYAVGVSPGFVAVADLNGDGNLDLAVANSPTEPSGQSGINYPVPGSVSVLFGNGDGSFQPQQVYSAGLAPSSIVVGDFNDNGQLDLAVTNSADGNVGIYLNQGHGTFSQPTVFYGTGFGVAAAVGGDFNGDQKLDLAVAVLNFSAVSVLLGKGDGSFSQAVLSYPTGSNPSGVAIANLNGDGKNDVVVANTGDNNVSVFLGNGDGTLQPRVNYSTGNGPSAVAVGDLRNDGNLDIVVANQSDSTVSVLLNNGNGTFQSHVDYSTAPGPVSVAIGDFNGDGKLDLAVACLSSISGWGGAVSVLLGNGDGTFQGHVDYPIAAWAGQSVVNAASIAVGDFNGDGKLDFAVAASIFTGYEASSGVDIFLNNGEGSFNPSWIMDNVCSQQCTGELYSIAAADLSGDGKLDLLVSMPFQVFMGNGDGTFQSFGTGGLDQYFIGYIAVADFNGDGFLDAELDAFGSALLLLGNGDGTFRVGQSNYNYTGYSQWNHVAAGDLNGDGKPDVVATNGSGYGGGSGNTLTVLLNTGEVASSFKVAVSPGSQTVDAGNSTTFTVIATTANGFNGGVTIACSSYPPGAACTANPGEIIPTTDGAASIVTVTTSTSTPVGEYSSLWISGTSGSEQFTVRPSLTVQSSTTPDFVLKPSPASLTLQAGNSGTFSIVGATENGFQGTISLTCSGQPSGPSCTPNPTSLKPTSSGASSTVTVTTSASMPDGTYSLTTVGTSGSVQHSVAVLLAVQSFAVSAPTSLTPSSVMAGQSAKATVTVSPGGGFTGVVALTCSVSPTPALAPTCSLNPAQVQVASGGQATSTLTVNTTGPTAYLGQPTLRRERIPIHAAMIPIFVMGLVGVGWRIGRGTKKKVIGLVICALLVGGEVFQVSCGGGGSRGTGTTGTPAGNYTVSVIASSGSMQHTASLTLTVQ